MEVDWQMLQLRGYISDSQSLLQRLRADGLDARLVRYALDLVHTYLKIPRASIRSPLLDEQMVRLVWNIHIEALQLSFWDDICVLWESMRPISRELTAPSHHAEITRQLAITLNNRGEAKRAQQLYEELIDSADFAQLPANQQADILHQAGVCYRMQGDEERAQQILQRCIAIADTHKAPASGAAAQSAESTRRGWEDPFTSSNRAAQLWEAKAYALNQLASMAQNRGAFERARHFYQECLALFLEQGEGENLACVAYQGLGELLTAEKEYAAAITLLTKNLDIRRRRGEEDGAAHAAILLAEAHVGHGQCEEAFTLLDTALAILRKVDDRSGLAHCHFVYGLSEQMRNRPNDATTQWQLALQMLSEHPWPTLQRRVLSALTLQHLHQGELCEAQQRLAALLHSLAAAQLLPHGAHARLGIASEKFCEGRGE